MGVLDQTSKIALEFKADTKQARAAIKKLKGVQKDTAKEVLDAQEKQNEGIDSQIVALGKLGGVIAAGAIAVKGLSVAAGEFAQRSQQMATIGNASFQQVAAATSNLITETQALGLAAKLSGGTFKVSQQQMELAAKAAVTLAQKQGTLEQALEAVGQALSEGNTEPLKKYGLVIKGVENDSIEGFNAALGLMNKQLEANAGFASRAGTGAQKAGVAWRDAIDKLVFSLGELAAALSPVVRQTAKLVSFLADPLSIDKQAETENLRFQQRQLRESIPELLRQAELRRTGRFAVREIGDITDTLLGGRTGAGQGGVDVIGKSLLGVLTKLEKKVTFDFKAPKGGSARALRAFESAQVSGVSGAATGSVFDALFGSANVQGLGAPGSQAIPGAGFSGALGGKFGATGPGTGIDALGGVFGDFRELVPELDATSKTFEQIVEGSQAASRAMQEFQNIGVQAFNAWIDGSKSLGEAIKGAFADSLKGIAGDMFGRFLYHGALALGSLAFGDMDGVARHGKAAAAFGAGALITGGLAKSMGGGGARTGGGGGAGGALAGQGARPGAGGTNREVIFIGVPPSDDPRETRRRMQDVLDRVAQENGGGTTVIRS